MINNPYLKSKYIVDMFLSKRFPDKIQMFNTKNVVGDDMKTIYDDGTVKIEYCEHWGYIEIFGLSEKDYEEIYLLHNGSAVSEKKYFNLQDILDLIDDWNKFYIERRNKE